MQSGMEPDDRLSTLPDDILVHVVKDLDLRAVVRLSALSRRWRHVPRLLSDLTIDVADFLPRDYGDEDDDEDDDGQRHRAIMLAYADAARKLLAPSAERSIKSLRLRFFLAEPSCRLLGDILEEASVVGTERLEFDVVRMTTTAQAAFGCGAASSSRLLQHKKDNVSRQRFMTFFTACPALALGCLTSLALHNLRFRARDVPRILGGCPRLQLLSLSHCSFRGRKAAASGLVVLQIDAPRSRLTALEVRFCWFLRVDVIRAPDLRRVHCDTWYGDSPPVRFGHVPRLRTLTLACNAREFLFLKDPFELAEFVPESGTDWSLSTLHLDLRDRMVSTTLLLQIIFTSFALALSIFETLLLLYICLSITRIIFFSKIHQRASLNLSRSIIYIPRLRNTYTHLNN